MTKLTSFELEDILDKLSKYKGRHTELISVYVPANYDANGVQKQLEAEKSTAKNIKSASTRKDVIEALEKIIRYLKSLKRTPENGLALFAGNISPVEGQTDLQLWDIEPPLPMKNRLYRCDKEFVLDSLREMLEVKEVFGLLVMDRKEATIGVLEGKRIEVLQKMTSGVPSKVRAGGQCLSPESAIETKKGTKSLKNIQIGDEIKALDLKSKKIIFTKCINKWERTKKYYIEIILRDCWSITCSEEHTFFVERDEKIKEVKAKELRLNDDLIILWNNQPGVLQIKEIKKNNQDIKLIDIETDAKNFFANGLLVHNSSQRFHRITEGLTKDFYKRIANEMKTIFYENPKLKGIIVGGPIPTKDEFLDDEYLPTKLREKLIGRIDIGGSDESGLKELVEKSKELLINQEIMIEKKLLEKFFNALGSKPDLVAYKKEDIKKALDLGAVNTLILSKNFDKPLGKTFKEMALNTSASIEVVSTDTEEGKQFENLGGIGALLRYKVE